MLIYYGLDIRIRSVHVSQHCDKNILRTNINNVIMNAACMLLLASNKFMFCIYYNLCSDIASMF